MIILLKRSKLFTVAPAKRFAKEFDVPETLWIDSWIKYKVMGLSTEEVCQYIHLRTGRKPSHNSISRWITRTEIYSISRKAIKMGATTVASSFFGQYEDLVIQELLKNMKSSATKDSKSIL